MDYSVEFGQSPQRRMDRIGFPDKVSNPGRLGLIEIEFGDIRRVEIHGALSVAILVDEYRAVCDLRHASPEFSHGVENLCLLAGSHSGRSGNRPQLRHWLTSALDHAHRKRDHSGRPHTGGLAGEHCARA